MKDVITIKKTEQKKAYVSARVSNVKLSEPTDIGNGDLLVPVDFRSPNQLFAMGKQFAICSGTEFDAELAAKAAKKTA